MLAMASEPVAVLYLQLGPLADASVNAGDGFGAGRGSLSPTSSVADLRPNRDAAVDKF